MSAVHDADPDNDVSVLDRLAWLAVQMVMAGAIKKAPALCALVRLAGDELAKIEGDTQSAIIHARLARIHEERSKNLLMRRR